MKRNSLKFRKVSQEHPMGCGVACVASITGKSYQTVLKATPNPSFAWTRGFYCSELVELLAKFGMEYKWRKCRKDLNLDKLDSGSLVFVAPCKKYPQGHFLIKLGPKKFMNPWKNFPSMKKVHAGYQSSVESVSYVIEPNLNVKVGLTLTKKNSTSLK